MNVSQISIDVNTGGKSQKVAVSATSAQSAVIVAPASIPTGVPVPMVLIGDVAFFVRYDANPTAVADGTDQYWPANTPLRTQVLPGGKFGLIAGGAGNVYITTGA